MSIYDLTGRMAALQEMLEGDIDPEQEVEVWQELEIAAEDMADKLDGYARIIRNLSAESAALKAESDRLTARKRTLDSRVEWLKNNVRLAMLATGQSKVKTGIGTWSVQKNPHSVIITDEAAIPQEYRIPQPDKIDSRAIIAAYKMDGEIIPGAEVVQTGGLRFR